MHFHFQSKKKAAFKLLKKVSKNKLKSIITAVVIVVLCFALSRTLLSSKATDKLPSPTPVKAQKVPTETQIPAPTNIPTPTPTSDIPIRTRPTTVQSGVIATWSGGGGSCSTYPIGWSPVF